VRRASSIAVLISGLGLLLSDCTSQGVSSRGAATPASTARSATTQATTAPPWQDRPPPAGLRGERPTTRGVRSSGWTEITGAAHVVGQGEGDALPSEIPPRWWLNPAGARLTAYHRWSLKGYNPPRPSTPPNVCSQRWTTAWRWTDGNGHERHWVSVAPAGDIAPTPRGFLVLGTRLGGYCGGRIPSGLTAGDVPWWYVDHRGDLHRLTWAAVPRYRDTLTGPVVCGRNPYRHSFQKLPPTRYCSFDPQAGTLSPLDFVPRDTIPIRLEPDGRVWGESTAESEPAGTYALAWTDNDGATWQQRPIDGDSDCTARGMVAACTRASGSTVVLSTDGGATWTETPVKKLLGGLSAPFETGNMTLRQIVVTPSGALIGHLGDDHRHVVVRRPPGQGTRFTLTPVRLRNTPSPQEALTEAAGMLVANYPVAALTRRPRQARVEESVPGAAWHPQPVWLSKDEGRTWHYQTLN
jgi:hypothetical protein